MIDEIVQNQRNYFYTNETKSLDFRILQLKKLQAAIITNKEAIFDALNRDLNKSTFESYMTEIGMVLIEIKHMIKNLRKWGKPQKKGTPIFQFPAKSWIINDPYGVVLIMAPWNYPLQLSLSPLIGAIAGGNTAIIKPSNYAFYSSKIIKKIISENFDEQYIAVVEGGREENTALLNQKFDFIFFTGGTTVGRLVMEKAAKNLTPIVLELGGKSPCIVSNKANIDLAAKRIMFGKILNAGQTCVAPDYVIVHEDIKAEFIKAIIHHIEGFLGKNPLANDDYPKIISDKHYQRLIKIIEQCKHIVYGGIGNGSKITPTIVDDVDFSSSIMEEEIFGPILPILSYNDLSTIVKLLNVMPKPLALYLFTNDKKEERQILNNVQFGGGCVNDTIMHLATTEMPFGGVGNSGMGKYHGKYSFMTFTHEKSILRKGKMDLPFRYHPYTEKKTELIKKFMK